MKTTKILFIALVMGLFTATTVQAQEKMKSDMKTKQMAKEMYVCPMHPDEKSEGPGTCSQCGMNMKKMDMKKVDMKKNKMMHDNMNHSKMDHSKMKSDSKKSMSAEMAGSYICPMKCEGEKTYSEVGNCPKCGMNLKEIEAKKEDHEGHKH